MGSDTNAGDAIACAGAVRLPLDTRPAQCKRAAHYMETHPGCDLREIGAGADLGSPSKVISEMVRTFGYQVRRKRERVPCVDSTRSRTVTRYWLLAWPVESQPDLFPET